MDHHQQGVSSPQLTSSVSRKVIAHQDSTHTCLCRFGVEQQPGGKWSRSHVVPFSKGIPSAIPWGKHWVSRTLSNLKPQNHSHCSSIQARKQNLSLTVSLIPHGDSTANPLGSQSATWLKTQESHSIIPIKPQFQLEMKLLCEVSMERFSTLGDTVNTLTGEHTRVRFHGTKGRTGCYSLKKRCRTQMHRYERTPPGSKSPLSSH